MSDHTDLTYLWCQETFSREDLIRIYDACRESGDLVPLCGVAYFHIRPLTDGEVSSGQELWAHIHPDKT